MSVQEEYRLLEMEVEEMSGKVERLTEECQERSDQANQWYKALQVHTYSHTPYTIHTLYQCAHAVYVCYTTMQPRVLSMQFLTHAMYYGVSCCVDRQVRSMYWS